MSLQNQKHHLSSLGVLAMLAGGFLGSLPVVYASSWSPTLLVNTEAFQVIDDTDSTADLYIQFGDSLNKRLTYDRTIGTFIFNDDLEIIGMGSGRHLHAQDLLTASGQTIIEGNQAYDPALLVVDQNSTTGSGQLIDSESTKQAGLIIDMPSIRYDAGSGGALNPHILFGYNNLFDTNLYRQSGSTLKTDDSLWVKKTVSGSTIRSFGLTDCDDATNSKLLWDETTGTFSCGTDQNSGGGGGSSFSGTGSLQAFFDNRYVEVAGDTMTGALVISPTTDSTNMLRVNDADGGTSVFTVDSTNERVGIGIDAPGTTLDVNGDARIRGTDGSLQLGRLVFTDRTGISAVGIWAGGNASTQTDFDISFHTPTADYAPSTFSVTGQSARTSNTTNLDGGPIELLAGNGASGSAGDADGGSIKLDGGTGYGTGDDGTILLQTVNGGNVGIGAATPTEKLEVVGTISGAVLHAESLLSSSGSLVVEGNLVFGDAISDTITVNARFASSLIPDTDDTYDLGSSSLRWRDVYVGPASLHIGTDGNEAQIGYDTTGNEIEFDADDDGTPEVVFEDTGKVGIGTQAPETTLEVLGSVSGSSLDVSGNTSIAGTLTTDTINEYSSGNGVTIDGLAIQDGYADASAIKVQATDSNVTRTVQDTFNYLNPAGRVTGGGVTDNGNGTVTIAAGSGYIRTSNTDTAPLEFVQWAQSGAITISTGTTRYFGVGYRSGSPAVVMKTTNTWNYNTDFPLYTVTNDSGAMEVSNNLHAITSAGGVLKRFYETRPLERDERTGGLILSETGTRNIAVTAGALWARLSRVSIDAIDTSVTDTFDRYYRDGGGGWTKESAQTQWNNTQYDDSSGTLATMTNNRYSVQWFYLETDGELVSLYGQDQYTSASGAEGAEAPDSVPDRLTEGGKLIGRVIFQKSGSTATAVQNVFATEFPTTLANDHGNLSGLTDDDHTQYALLAGRSGGQSLIGGTAAGEDLTLSSTSDGTKGTLFFGSNAAFDEVNTRLGIGTTSPETALEVVGTASGTQIHAQDRLTSSGTLVVEGNVTFGGSLTFGSLTSCTALQTDGSGVVSCGAGGGLTETNADARYVNTSGDTMTGALLIAPESGTLALELNGTLSGSTIHAQDTVTSSGVIVADAHMEAKLIATLEDATNLNQLKEFEVVGSLVYATASTDNSLQIIDISDPKNPAIIGEVQDAVSLEGAHAVEVQGNYAYVASSTRDSLTVIDVSIPSSPFIVSELQNSTSLNFIDGLFISGRYLYAVTGIYDSLHIIDIKDPKNPRVVGFVRSTSANGDLDGAQDVVVQGNYAYVSARSSNSITIVDVTDPSNPSVVGRVDDDTNLDEVYTIDVQGKYLYAASYTDDSVQIIDISDPASASIVKELTDATLLNGARGVSVAGHYLYVAMRDANALAIYDIQDPENPTLESYYSHTGSGPVQSIVRVKASGRYAYVGGLNGRISILDVGGIEAPTARIGSLLTGNLEALDEVTFGDRLKVMGGVTIGQGLMVQGNTGLFSSSGYTLDVHSSGVSDGAIRIATEQNNSINNPHILFGYHDMFDVQLFRQGTGSLTVHSSTGSTFRIDSEMTGTTDLFQIVSDQTTDENTVFRFQANGQAYAEQNWNSGGADFAEWFPTADEGMTPGDIACLDPSRPKHVKRCNAGGLQMVGVVSTNPGFVGNSAQSIQGTSVLVGMIGQVPVKVLGNIAIGDEITLSSTDGVGKKASGYDQTVCVAMEPHQGKDPSLITCLLSRNNTGNPSNKNTPVNAESVADYLLKNFRSSLGSNKF